VKLAMQREAAAGVRVPASHAAGHYGRLTMWALGCALVVIVAHVAAPGFGPRLGPYRSGIATLGTFALASVYTVRKRWMWLTVRVMRIALRMPHAIAHRLLLADRLESWRLYHVILGVAVLLPLWWHIAQGGGASPLEAALGAAAAMLLLSGLAGAVIQDFLPHSTRIRPAQEVRLEDVDAALHEVYVQAEETILGRSEALVQTYLKQVRPVMLGTRPARALFMATLSGADPAAPVAARLRRQGAQIPNEAETWERLVTLAERKVQLDHNRFNLSLSIGWMRVHIALAVALGVLTVFHVAGVLYFAGL
jgi:hypothetical protein